MRNIFIVVDGVGYEQVAHFMPEGLAKHAERRGLCALDTLLAYSSGIYPSIWSGQYPALHGVWTEFHRRKSRAFTTTLPLRLLTGKYFPRKVAYVWLEVLRKLGISTTDYYAIPPSIQPHFSRSDADYTRIPPVPMSDAPIISRVIEQAGQTWEYVYCHTLDEIAEQRIKDTARRVDMVMVCLPELDEAGHHLGPMTDAFGVVFAKFAQRVDKLLSDLERDYPDAGMFLFSDHGMTTVTESFDVWTYLEKQDLRLGRDYLAFINSTIVSLWFDDRSPRGVMKKERVIKALNASGYGRVLSLEEHKKYKIDFASHRYGERFFVANEGIDIIPNFISASWKAVHGMHGYDPSCASTRSFFIGGKQVSSHPHNVVDLYDVLLETVYGRQIETIVTPTYPGDGMIATARSKAVAGSAQR